jgi:Protein of unknown function (DUF2752)
MPFRPTLYPGSVAPIARPGGQATWSRRLVAARAEIDLLPMRWLGGAMLALGVVLPHLSGNPGLPCPLRTATGVPCPFCGMTTSVKATMRGDLGGATVANPFGILAVVAAVVLQLRPSWRSMRIPTVVLLGGVAVSWLFELHRFHVI